MRIGITGANGFIGRHLCRYLSGEKYDLVFFLQQNTSGDMILPFVKKPQNRLFWGDLADKETLATFVSHCDAIIHLAGINQYWTEDFNIFYQVNVIGTRNLAEACIDQGIKKLIHVSSCITLGASDGPYLRSEQSGFNLRHIAFPYALSKYLAEQEVLKLHDLLGLPVVVVHPASAIGEMDQTPTPIGKPIIDICRGRLPVYVDGGACFIDVHDVAKGLCLALEKGRIGERYLLAGDNLLNSHVARAEAA